eukprot:m51a1_g6322 hypothetical protein (638) ;mRNA; r:356719-360935
MQSSASIGKLMQFMADTCRAMAIIQLQQTFTSILMSMTADFNQTLQRQIEGTGKERDATDKYLAHLGMIIGKFAPGNNFFVTETPGHGANVVLSPLWRTGGTVELFHGVLTHGLVSSRPAGSTVACQSRLVFTVGGVAVRSLAAQAVLEGAPSSSPAHNRTSWRLRTRVEAADLFSSGAAVAARVACTDTADGSASEANLTAALGSCDLARNASGSGDWQRLCAVRSALGCPCALCSGRCVSAAAAAASEAPAGSCTRCGDGVVGAGEECEPAGDAEGLCRAADCTCAPHAAQAAAGGRCAVADSAAVVVGVVLQTMEQLGKREPFDAPQCPRRGLRHSDAVDVARSLVEQCAGAARQSGLAVSAEPRDVFVDATAGDVSQGVVVRVAVGPNRSAVRESPVGWARFHFVVECAGRAVDRRIHGTPDGYAFVLGSLAGVAVSPVPAACGNGAVDAGEQCDGGPWCSYACSCPAGSAPDSARAGCTAGAPAFLGISVNATSRATFPRGAGALRALEEALREQCLGYHHLEVANATLGPGGRTLRVALLPRTDAPPFPGALPPAAVVEAELRGRGASFCTSSVAAAAAGLRGSAFVSEWSTDPHWWPADLHGTGASGTGSPTSCTGLVSAAIAVLFLILN